MREASIIAKRVRKRKEVWDKPEGLVRVSGDARFPKKPDALPTFRLLIAYDGTAFHGWQAQPDRPTVQAVLEAAATTALRTPVTLVGSGRTDAGVHARGQVAHFTTFAEVNPSRLRNALNGILPKSIGVLDVARAPDGFHARYDARRRRYHYYVSLGPRPLERRWRHLMHSAPDFDRMNEAALALIGTRDFSAFCRTKSETKNRVCTVAEARWVAEEREGDRHFRIVADRVLHGMVRAIVGTLIEIGRGRRSVDDLSRVLASGDRREAGPAAPAHGLVLEHVGYE